MRLFPLSFLLLGKLNRKVLELFFQLPLLPQGFGVEFLQLTLGIRQP